MALFAFKPIISKETFYDEDMLLHYCYIGLDDPQMTLLLTVWGSTPEICRTLAESLLKTIA